jgi:hypothetical protein
MKFLRTNLSRIAALAVLLWVCAAGVAFAQSCSSPTDVECDHCWTQAKPSVPKVPAVADIDLPVVPRAWEPVFAVAARRFECGSMRGRGPADLRSRERIPIEFLRLVL